MNKALFLGIDVGTQGVRAAALDGEGRLAAEAGTGFSALSTATVPGRLEQRPGDWYEALRESVRACVAKVDPAAIRGIAVDGTSATVLPLGEDFSPLSDAIMYNDGRAAQQAAALSRRCPGLEERLGYRFNASFALPKLLWIKEERPRIYEATRLFVHQADYIVGRLTGEYGVTDWSNALKTGYDAESGCWPGEVDILGREKLPRVVKPGEFIAGVSGDAARELGLRPGTPVFAGCTDGYASALSAGALRPGDWASIIGTTLVLKGVCRQRPTAFGGYSHRLPSGAYMPGGACNIGGRCIAERFDSGRLEELNLAARDALPSPFVCYPLTGKGERFPFSDPEAMAFMLGKPETDGQLFAAFMQGVGFAERLCYDVIRRTMEVGDVISTSGGACKSPLWLKLRASILHKQLRVPALVGADVGAALLAASGELGSLERAAGLIRFSSPVDPDPAWEARLDDLYGVFLAACKERYRL